MADLEQKQIDVIKHEMNLCQNEIDFLRAGANPFIRIFITIFLGEIGLIAFMEKPGDDNIVLANFGEAGMLGIMINIFLFIISGVLFAYYTKVIKVSRINRNQISFYRKKLIELTQLKEYNILPISKEVLYSQIEKHIPTLAYGILILIISLSYYFFRRVFETDPSYIHIEPAGAAVLFYFSIVFAFFGLLLRKYYFARNVAFGIRPNKDEHQTSLQIRKIEVDTLKSKKWIRVLRFLKYLFILTCGSVSLFSLVFDHHINLVYSRVIWVSIVSMITLQIMDSFNTIKLK